QGQPDRRPSLANGLANWIWRDACGVITVSKPTFGGKKHETSGFVSTFKAKSFRPALGDGAMVLQKNSGVAAGIGMLADPGLGRQQVAGIAQDRQAGVQVGVAVGHFLTDQRTVPNISTRFSFEGGI